jgi:pantetheine-phosphate adenylyltransferase
VVVPGRHTTGLYLPEYGILLDAGSNVFPLRTLHGDGPLHVLMSHYHLDHSMGLFFLSAGLFHGREKEPEIRVCGPEWENRFRDAAGADSALWPIEFPFPIRQAAERFEVAGVEITTRAVPHASPVIAYRLRFPDGETLAYVTDTTAPGDYLDFIRGVDVLVHECSFRAGEREWALETHHSEAVAVGQLARDAGVKKLYLTHIGPLADPEPLLEEVRERFPAAEIPIEGLCYPVDGSAVDPRRAVFPGSFDPLTVSHLDIMRTCVEMFTSVHVLVARNPAKDRDALFEPAERAELIRRCVDPSVKVSVWDGLTIDYARKVQAGRVVRGLGRAEDYTVEVRLWKTNALLGPEMQTVWVPPRPEHLDVSSSMVKEAAFFGGWDRVKHLVPDEVREDVGRRITEKRNQP